VNPYRGRFGTQPLYLIQLTLGNQLFRAAAKPANAAMRISFPIRISAERPSAELLGQLNPGSFTISK